MNNTHQTNIRHHKTDQQRRCCRLFVLLFCFVLLAQDEEEGSTILGRQHAIDTGTPILPSVLVAVVTDLKGVYCCCFKNKIISSLC